MRQSTRHNPEDNRHITKQTRNYTRNTEGHSISEEMRLGSQSVEETEHKKRPIYSKLTGETKERGARQNGDSCRNTDNVKVDIRLRPESPQSGHINKTYSSRCQNVHLPSSHRLRGPKAAGKQRQSLVTTSEAHSFAVTGNK